MTNDLVSNLQTFLDEERIEMKVWEASSSEFWILSPDDSLAARFLVDDSAQEISYDFFSTENDVHLKMQTLTDLEKIESAAENHKRWGFAKAVEDLWIILDKVKILAQRNNFKVQEKEII